MIEGRSRRRIAAAFGLYAIAFGGASFAATTTVGAQDAAPGESRVRLPVTLALGSGEQVGGLQFDLVFDANALELQEVATGAAAKAASKDVFSSPLSSGRVRVLIAGLNQNTIADGVVADAFFGVASRARAGSLPIAVKSVVLSDPFGNAVPAQHADGAITVHGQGPAAPTQESSRGGCFGGVTSGSRGDDGGAWALFVSVAATLLCLRSRLVPRPPRPATGVL